MRKHTFEEVKQYFEEAGCELLQNTYINVRSSVKYRCSCGNESDILFSNFRRGQRCIECSGNKHHTFEYVKKYFSDNDCELIETEYKNNKASMKYVCSCRNTSITNFDKFKRGHRCMECSGSIKYTFEYVKRYFLDNDCELLETCYKNNTTYMKYVCECGTISSTSFNHFRNGVRCIDCANESKRHDFKVVKNYFMEAGCELLETSYKNCSAKLKYVCSCGNTSVIRFAHFKNGQRCMECANVERRHSFDHVKNYFEENDCVLLEKSYKGVGAKMRYTCSCGEESSISFTSFQKGVRCVLCGYDKASKSSYNFKDYICPDGTSVRCQGYEYLALDELYSSYNQSDIENARRNMPLINYDFEGNTCKYFPDIFIKSENKVIEVKSYYTYKKNLVKNILKSLATRKAGFDYEVWFYTPMRGGRFSKHIM